MGHAFFVSTTQLCLYSRKTATEFMSTVGMAVWRRQWHPTPVLLPGKSHGQRNLEGCSPRGRWGSDTTERLQFHFSLWCIGEGNGNPLQCSCLENPMDGGAWWAAIYGVAQNQTWLKWLSRAEQALLWASKMLLGILTKDFHIILCHEIFFFLIFSTF